ncbi:MAG TPA: 2-amino-4-hydroxy-6-hydroxymethyldihydropteridine diphosphokinase [Deltaproteobacteria bacterium]|jgi:2-amino-4-hydroxy-6-hydroxymethyldihydropteridine diphosphokinase|nr:2-amino-4-hydroxy-6-hydroxymethyldihydropteridine diphosphokinase [Deltaproteobacteria bacterium]HQI00938.1 2-amino-4-hydroxy-6-hydroxymethyldihydropteridine diphosphokinase [Deltaproteobacteria bacterium]
MEKAFVSVGSNIDPAGNVRKGIMLLARRMHVTGLSTVYMTPPIGRPEQGSYYNCVVKIETEASPAELKHGVLRPIEDMLGRRRTDDAYAPRTMDLDLILYDELTGRFDDLILPDPDIFERTFLAACLKELAPEMIVPGTGITVSEISERLGARGLVPLREYSESLRKEVAYAARYPQDRVFDRRSPQGDRRRPRP